MDHINGQNPEKSKLCNSISIAVASYPCHVRGWYGTYAGRHSLYIGNGSDSGTF